MFGAQTFLWGTPGPSPGLKNSRPPTPLIPPDQSIKEDGPGTGLAGEMGGRGLPSRANTLHGAQKKLEWKAQERLLGKDCRRKTSLSLGTKEGKDTQGKEICIHEWICLAREVGRCSVVWVEESDFSPR